MLVKSFLNLASFTSSVLIKKYQLRTGNGGGGGYIFSQLEVFHCMIIKLISQEWRKNAEFQNKETFFLNYSKSAKWIFFKTVFKSPQIMKRIAYVRSSWFTYWPTLLCNWILFIWSYSYMQKSFNLFPDKDIDNGTYTGINASTILLPVRLGVQLRINRFQIYSESGISTLIRIKNTCPI